MDVDSVATWASTVIALFGLFGALLTIRQNTRAMEPQVLESIFKDIRELDRQYISQFASWSHAEKNAWSATFFNTVEYLCFVVNHQIIRQPEVKRYFFDQGLPAWRKMLHEHVRDGIINDSPEMFPEFKSAYEKHQFEGVP